MMKYLKFSIKILIIIFIIVIFDLIAGFLYQTITRPPEMFYNDERIGLRHLLDIDKITSWPEAKNGVVNYKTNNLGFREDSPTPVICDKKRRIMVFGDSHTDGVIDNALSFPNLTEAILNHDNPLSTDIINAASGHTCLFQQSLHLQEWLYLKPDKAVFVFYTGNDYLEMLWDFIPHPGWNEQGEMIFLTAEQKPVDFTSYSVILRVLRRFDNSLKMKAERINRYAMWQSFSQAQYLHENKDSFDKSSRFHDATVKTLKKIANENHFDLLFIILPTKYQIEPGTDSVSFRKLEQLLGLSSGRKADDRVRKDFISILTENEMNFIDLHDTFLTASRNEPSKPLYWNSDHHLSEFGHEVVAKIWANYESTQQGLIQDSMRRK